MKNKILVAGTGRSGTSLLIDIFTHLNMDTGFSSEETSELLKNNMNAGLEILDLNEDIQIQKAPHFSLNIVDIINNFPIKHIIIPIRNLDDVTKSRENTLFWDGTKAITPKDTESEFGFVEQKCFNGELIYNLIHNLTKYNIEYTTIPFPEYCTEKNLLYDKLNWLFDLYGISKKEVNKVIEKLYNKNKINF